MNSEAKGSLTVLGIILGVSLILSTALGAYTFYRIRTFDNALSVTGSAKKQVKADTVKWVTVLTRTAGNNGLKEGYTAMDANLTLVKNFFAQNGFAEKDLTISPVFVDQMYMERGVGERQYQLRQTIELRSNDIEKVTQLSKNTGSLINQGAVFSTQSLEYFYSKLPDLRVALLADALKDARARANEIAKSGGRNVGPLKSASSGVVQVLSANSVEVSDYGSYDTSNIDKEVMVTVKASFVLR